MWKEAVAFLLKLLTRNCLQWLKTKENSQNLRGPTQVSKEVLPYSGPGSVVGIATSYGLDGPGIESRWWARFSSPVQTGPLAHPASFTMGTGSFPGLKKRFEHDADASPPSSAVGHEWVELYLYSPYGPYGLYRDSVPVQGCTVPLPYSVFRTCFMKTGKRWIMGKDTGANAPKSQP